ncbi:hypothetical protein Sjap_013544 [Stephania japonica]|uniref:Uncharacterized protein n=1 Tax=Stephania japonica TaxID=461633 RepID=A0AAP0IXZ4_9MAGN
MPISSPRPPPLLMNLSLRSADRVSYCADMASKLAMDKRLDDFVMILESNGSDLSVLVGLLDARMVSAGICGLICEGRVGEVVRVFRLVEGLGIGAFELCDELVKAVLGLELRRLVEEGELGEVEVEVEVRRVRERLKRQVVRSVEHGGVEPTAGFIRR